MWCMHAGVGVHVVALSSWWVLGALQGRVSCRAAVLEWEGRVVRRGKGFSNDLTLPHECRFYVGLVTVVAAPAAPTVAAAFCCGRLQLLSAPEPAHTAMLGCV
jgi:hypothetical protein